MNTQLLLVRHGDVVRIDEEGTPRPDQIYNGNSAHLTKLGLRQLKSLGKRLAAEGLVPDVVFSSDFSRTMISAKGLISGLGVDLRPIGLSALQDVYAPGWDGVPKEEFIQLTHGDVYSFEPQTHKQRLYMRDQESLAALILRQRRAGDRIQKRVREREEQPDLIAVVGHGDASSAFHWVHSHVYGFFPASYWEMQDSFKLEKAEAHLLTVDPAFHIVGEGRRIRIPEVDQSVEGWRTQGSERK